MSALFQALLSAQYHATKAMAMADAKAGEAKYLPGDAQRWLARVTRREGRANRILRRFTSIDEAARVLVEHPRSARDDRTWRHARAALSAAHHVTVRHGLETRQSTAVGEALDGLLQRSTHDLLEVEDAWAAFAYGYRFDEEGLPPSEGDFQLHVNCAQLDDSDVTIFDAELTREAPDAVTLGKIAQKSDPRKWDQTFPDLFAQSYLIESLAECTERYVDPSPGADNELAAEKGFDGYLFEEATLGFIGRFRNILKIELRLEPNRAEAREGKVDIAYSLHEPLSNIVLGLQQPGGFDVDSAGPPRPLALKDDHPCRISLEWGESGSLMMKTRASKRLRFSEYTELSDELNLFALPLLNVWITSLLVNSVYIP